MKLNVNESTFKAQFYARSDCRGTFEMADAEVHWACCGMGEYDIDGKEIRLECWVWFIRDMETGTTLCFTCNDPTHVAVLALATAGDNVDGLLSDHFGRLAAPIFADAPQCVRIIP